MGTPKKRESKNLVSVGSHVPEKVKHILMEVAKKNKTTMYKLVQKILQDASIELSKSKSNGSDDSDLLA